MLNSFEWAMWIITVSFLSFLLSFFINRKLNSFINQFEDVWREIRDIKERLRPTLENALQNKHAIIQKELSKPDDNSSVKRDFKPEAQNFFKKERKHPKKSKK